MKLRPDLQYQISNAIFDLFPDYCRGVVVACGVNNQGEPDELSELLRLEEKHIEERFGDRDLNEVERLASWRDAFRQVGIKPTKHRPSIDGLVRRAVQAKQLPLINPLVDIGNIFSLRHILPVGGHAIDILSEGMELRLATGDERFTPFESGQPEQPEKGEIIFVDGQEVMTRRWVWRQGIHSLIQPSSTAVEINIDGLPPVKIEEVEQICQSVSALIKKYCGGETFYQILTVNNPSMRLLQG